MMRYCIKPFLVKARNLFLPQGYSADLEGMNSISVTLDFKNRSLTKVPLFNVGVIIISF